VGDEFSGAVGARLVDEVAEHALLPSLHGRALAVVAFAPALVVGRDRREAQQRVADIGHNHVEGARGRA